jgi:hypothetical protein
MRGTVTFMQELEERRAQFQNLVDSVKMIVKVEDDRHDGFQNEMDSMKKIIT